MEKLLGKIKEILANLPLQGSKTILGLALAYFAAKYQLPHEVLDSLLKYFHLNAETAGLGLALIGIGSKYSKI